MFTPPPPHYGHLPTTANFPLSPEVAVVERLYIGLTKGIAASLVTNTRCFLISRISPWQEVRFIKQALFPVLMCHAASRGDIDAMEELSQQVTSDLS